MRTLVLERREIVGGAAVTEEVWPGWKVSTAAYVCSLLDPRIVADLDLPAHGYAAYRKDPSSFTPLLDGRSLLLGADAESNAREIAAFEPRDVAGIRASNKRRRVCGAILAAAFDAEPNAPIDVDTSVQFEDSAAALVERYVETPVLAATLATDGIIGTYAGPRDPGTGYVLAHHYAGRALGEQGAWGYVRGGMGALSQAIASAALAAGAEIRTQAPVARILVRDGRACGVILDDGETIEAAAILSNAASLYDVPNACSRPANFRSPSRPACAAGAAKEFR